MSTVRFQTVEFFAGNPAACIAIENMIDGEQSTSGVINYTDGVATSVVLRDPEVAGNVEGVDEITFQIDWQDGTSSKAAEIASIYYREVDGGAWTEAFSQEITLQGWITTTVTIPITNFADLQILIEYFFQTGGGDPPPPPVFET